MGLFDQDYKNDVKVEGIDNYKPGDYYVLITGTQAVEDEYRYLKVYAVVLHTLHDLGESNTPGDEVSHAMFKRKKTSFFEKETKLYCKAGQNLDKDTANALTAQEVGAFLLDKTLKSGKVKKAPIINRILEVKAREIARKEGDEDDDGKPKKAIIRVTPVRALTMEEAAQEINKKILRRYCPDGIVEPVTAGEDE